MRLRSKLMLITAAASITPVVLATLVGRSMVQSRSRAGFERRLDEGEQRVLAEYSSLQREVKDAVEQLSKGDEDLFTQQILIALAKGSPDAALVRRLNDETPGVMRQRGLDVLTVLGPGKRVLACGHFPGRMGDVAPRGLSISTKPLLVSERVLQAGRPESLLTVQVWRTAKHSLGTKARVMGGRALDARFLRGLRGRLSGTEVLLQDASGRRLAGPEDWQRYGHFPRRVVRLVGPDGNEAARVTLAVSDEQLRTTLRVINYVAATLIGGGLLLSLLLGFVARRVSRPLEELAVGAQAVASGDLERKIPVRSRDEIGELVATFNHMTEQLLESQDRLAAAERVAAWRAIAQRIAHEIKNPLFPIQTSIETLRKVYRKKHPKFDEIFEESTTTILDEVARLKRIVTEFSSFARLPKPALAPCDLVELVRSLVVLHPSGAIPMKLELDEQLPQVMADREQLTQVLHNLIKNAAEALAETADPQITVQLQQGEGGSVLIAVHDNGPGFVEEKAAQLFTPYFTTKGSSGGSGLGLAIVHRIVTDHGGTIEARNSRDGSGAVFTVRLPTATNCEPAS